MTLDCAVWAPLLGCSRALSGSIENLTLMAFVSETQLEVALLEQFAGLCYPWVSDDRIGLEGEQPKRDVDDEAALKARLTAGVTRIIPALSPKTHTTAIRRLTQSEPPILPEENCRLHKSLTRDVDVEYFTERDALAAGAVVRTIKADVEQSISVVQLRNALLPKMIFGEARIADAERIIEARS